MGGAVIFSLCSGSNPMIELLTNVRTDYVNDELKLAMIHKRLSPVSTYECADEYVWNFDHFYKKPKNRSEILAFTDEQKIEPKYKIMFSKDNPWCTATGEILWPHPWNLARSTLEWERAFDARFAAWKRKHLKK